MVPTTYSKKSNRIKVVYPRLFYTLKKSIIRKIVTNYRESTAIIQRSVIHRKRIYDSVTKNNVSENKYLVTIRKRPDKLYFIKNDQESLYRDIKSIEFTALNSWMLRAYKRRSTSGRRFEVACCANLDRYVGRFVSCTIAVGI